MSGRTEALKPVADDLRRIFGDRLEALVAYGWRRHQPTASLALVRTLSLDDLNACAARTGSWARAGAATPLLLTRTDFTRSLDAFPIEYGEILASHEVVVGDNPFGGLSIRPEDRRRACEVQTKSHLLHLREDYMEAAGRSTEIEVLVRESAPGFAALLRHLAGLDEVAIAADADLMHYAEQRLRLNGHVVSALLVLADPEGFPPVDALRLFPEYLAAVEHLADFVDRWREA
jgi:hypothetical protein